LIVLMIAWMDEVACCFCDYVQAAVFAFSGVRERPEIEYEVVPAVDVIVTVSVTDDLHPALIAVPRLLEVVVYPRDAVRAVLECYPGRRWGLSGWGRSIFGIGARCGWWSVGQCAMPSRMYACFRHRNRVG